MYLEKCGFTIEFIYWLGLRSEPPVMYIHIIYAYRYRKEMDGIQRNVAMLHADQK